MDEIRIHPHALRHGLSREEVTYAWREIEMVGMVLADGATLVIHALSPATKRMKRELRLERK